MKNEAVILFNIMKDRKLETYFLVNFRGSCLKNVSGILEENELKLVNQV